MNTYEVKARRNGATFDQLFNDEHEYLDKCESLLQNGWLVYSQPYDKWGILDSNGKIVYIKNSDVF
jgi:hypothetical protein